MTSTEPEITETARYSITETCKILSLSIKTVIKYTEQGNLKCGFRKHNQRRFYTGSEIKRFWKAQV